MSGLSRFVCIPFVILLLLGGCATVPPDFKEPTLQLNSIQLKNANSLTPEFEISLRVKNPNRDALDIRGLTYTLFLADNEVVSGVADEIPTIAALGEADVHVMATLSLFDGLKFLSDLMNQYEDSANYKLVIKLDAGRLYPMITIVKDGALAF